VNSCIVIPHNGLGDHINMVSMCKYLSNIYDTVYYISIYDYDYLFDNKYNFIHHIKKYIKN